MSDSSGFIMLRRKLVMLYGIMIIFIYYSGYIIYIYYTIIIILFIYLYTILVIFSDVVMMVDGSCI